jgi:hypothetical protein
MYAVFKAAVIKFPLQKRFFLSRCLDKSNRNQFPDDKFGHAGQNEPESNVYCPFYLQSIVDNVSKNE